MKNLMLRMVTSAGVVLALVLSPALALAAGDGGFTFTVEGFYIIDFVIFIAVLGYLVRGPAKKFIRARYERMTSEMQAASRLKAEADQKLGEIERLFAALGQEVQTIRDQFKADGERERDRIHAETEAQTAKAQAAVQKQLEQETAALKEQLSIELVNAVLAATEAKVRARVDQSVHKALTGAYIDNLEKLDKLTALDKAA